MRLNLRLSRSLGECRVRIIHVLESITVFVSGLVPELDPRVFLCQNGTFEDSRCRLSQYLGQTRVYFYATRCGGPFLIDSGPSPRWFCCLPFRSAILVFLYVLFERLRAIIMSKMCTIGVGCNWECVALSSFSVKADFESGR